MDQERAPIADSPLSVVLTMFTGGAETERQIREWAAYLNGSGKDYELLLCPEKTDPVLADLGAAYARARTVFGDGPAGFGNALRAGLAVAQHPLLAYQRLLPGFKPSDLKQLLRVIDEVDLVVAVRGRHRPTLRERGWQLLLRFLFGLRLQDPGCFFLLARRAIFERIPVQSAGPFAHAEVLAKANFLGCLMTEMVVNRPAAEAAAEREPFFADLRRVFRHPDFGPAQLPSGGAWN